MPPAAKRPAPRTRPRTVVGQMRAAWASPVSAVLGVMMGGLVPLATYYVTHAQVVGWPMVVLVVVLSAGGLLYSAPTVFDWAREALGSRPKAIGFVVLLEGVMVSADLLRLHWLGVVCLAYLVAINAAATACRLAFGDRT